MTLIIENNNCPCSNKNTAVYVIQVYSVDKHIDTEA